MNKKSAIETLRNSLNESKEKSKKLTIKEMIYNDEVEQYEDTPGYDSTPDFETEKQFKVEEPSQQNNTPIEKPLPEERETDPEIMKMLSNIRLAVINGLAKLANKPDSLLYDTMKKLLVIIDKPIETGNKEK